MFPLNSVAHGRFVASPAVVKSWFAKTPKNLRYLRGTTENGMNKSLYPIPARFAAAANLKHADYERTYAESVDDPERLFWHFVDVLWIFIFPLLHMGP
jgi:hypothetical protein